MLKYLFLVLILFNCQPVTPDRRADLKDILTKVLTHEETKVYLNNYILNNKLLFFRYEELPVYNSVVLPKPAFNIIYKKGRIIQYNLNAKNEINNPVIIIESIVVDENTARVRFRIPVEGVYGTFSLHKETSWVVKTANVYET